MAVACTDLSKDCPWQSSPSSCRSLVALTASSYPAAGRIPTPCSAKRIAEDEEDCCIVHKRLRASQLQSYTVSSPALAKIAEHDDATFACTKRDLQDEMSCCEFSKKFRHNGCLDGSSADNFCPYQAVNGMLHRIHAERRARRQPGGPPNLLSQMQEHEALARADDAASTSFTLSDVVQCGHGAAGRCMQCSGRTVENVPLTSYSAFCHAYYGPHFASASPSVLSEHCGLMSPELSFPAFVSLVASLVPAADERFLHIGSGFGRAVLAWALLMPQSAASGLEANLVAHRAAIAAVDRLGPAEQQRAHLHHCDPFSVQSDWRMASVILVSMAGFDDVAVERVVEGLRGAEPGTRVVTLSRPLAMTQSQLPAGLNLVRQSLYRTTGSGNVTAFLYRKAA